MQSSWPKKLGQKPKFASRSRTSENVLLWVKLLGHNVTLNYLELMSKLKRVWVEIEFQKYRYSIGVGWDCFTRYNLFTMADRCLWLKHEIQWISCFNHMQISRIVWLGWRVSIGRKRENMENPFVLMAGKSAKMSLEIRRWNIVFFILPTWINRHFHFLSHL